MNNLLVSLVFKGSYYFLIRCFFLPMKGVQHKTLNRNLTIFKKHWHFNYLVTFLLAI